jgi:NADH:quinone reductase (non-electrogenic)
VKDSDSAPLPVSSRGSKRRVVVIGAGFAGLRAVRDLASAPVDVIVVDRRNHHLFQPLLYQVATAGLNPSDIAHPIRSILRRQGNATTVLAEVKDVDIEARSIALEDRVIEYDWLVVASGATHSYFGRDDWADHAPGLKSVEDALEIRRRILRAFEKAELDPERREEWLTFVVIGAGPTGVELAGAICEIARHALSNEFRGIEPALARVVLIEGADHVLPSYPEELSQSARRQLEQLGVEVRTGTMVKEIDRDLVRCQDDQVIPTRTVLWAAGVKGSSIGARLGVDTDRQGRVPVEGDLSVPGHPEVFVAGDLAAIESEGEMVPGVAPAALQAGAHVARCIRADIKGKSRPQFRYRDKGSLATIGRIRAVADLGRLRFSGFFAWLTWMFVHIFFLVGFRNRIFVLISWAWNYLTFRRGARLITGRWQPNRSDQNRRAAQESIGDED